MLLAIWPSHLYTILPDHSLRVRRQTVSNLRRPSRTGYPKPQRGKYRRKLSSLTITRLRRMLYRTPLERHQRKLSSSITTTLSLGHQTRRSLAVYPKKRSSHITTIPQLHKLLEEPRRKPSLSIIMILRYLTLLLNRPRRLSLLSTICPSLCHPSRRPLERCRKKRSSHTITPTRHCPYHRSFQVTATVRQPAIMP